MLDTASSTFSSGHITTGLIFGIFTFLGLVNNFFLTTNNSLTIETSS